MEHTIRMDAEDFVALTAPEAIFSDGELLREAARAVQNGHADSVDCKAGKEFAVVTYVYTLASNTWTF